MKNNYLFVNLTIVLAIGLMFIVPAKQEDGRRYTPRNQKASESARGAIDYMTSLRVNQITKTIDVNDIVKAQEQLNAKKLLKAGGTNWKFRGPNNIGGRTRAILFDKDNANVIYAGSVSGGLWKSSTAGITWSKVDYLGATSEDFANLAVTTICQSTNGDIYFGTGEGFMWNHGTNIATPMILGAGIWKSTDHGQTFTRLTSTWNETNMTDFTLVFKMVAHPTENNTIYAATGTGLKVSVDGGSTWSSVTLDDDIYNGYPATDVEISSSGNVIASIANRCFLKESGSNTFANRSGNIDDSLINEENIGRLEFAYAPSNSDYVYCLAADAIEGSSLGMLENVYKSVDGGNTWVVVGKGGSGSFQPLGHQGIYDMAIAVNPINEEEVFIAGLDVYVGNKVPVGDLFEWNQISLNYWPQNSPQQLYVHADQHTIVFNPENPKEMFVGSDGGISKGVISNDGYGFVTMNNNYAVTQFYSVAANNNGTVIGGAQDNSTVLVPFEDDQTGYVWLGGDGGQVAMSKFGPNITYATYQFGGVERTNDANFSVWNTFYTSEIADQYGWSSGDYESNEDQAAFVTPVALWETQNDPYTTDSIMFIVRQDTTENGNLIYAEGTWHTFGSENIYRAPITIKLTKDYYLDDTIWMKDPYSSLFAFGMARTVWMTRKAGNMPYILSGQDYWRVINSGVLSYTEYITHLAFSADGDHLFFATSDQELYRLSNLNMARTNEDASYILGGLNVITELTKIGMTPGASANKRRVVTDIACDPNDPDNLIITLGNYDNENYVYFCANATTAAESSDLSNFVDATGDLPKMPVYTALFKQTNWGEQDKTVFIGTEMGVFMSESFLEQVTATNVVWNPDQEGVGPVPVMEIFQNNTPNNFAKGRRGSMYIATHGLGIFETKDYLDVQDAPFVENQNSSNNKLKFDVYPNPVNDYAAIDIYLPSNGELTTEIFNLSGQLMLKQLHGFVYAGDNKLEINNLSNLKDGVYIVRVSQGNSFGSARIVKK